MLDAAVQNRRLPAGMTVVAGCGFEPSLHQASTTAETPEGSARAATPAVAAAERGRCFRRGWRCPGWLVWGCIVRSSGTGSSMGFWRLRLDQTCGDYACCQHRLRQQRMRQRRRAQVVAWRIETRGSCCRGDRCETPSCLPRFDVRAKPISDNHDENVAPHHNRITESRYFSCRHRP